MLIVVFSGALQTQILDTYRMWLGFWHKYGVDMYLRLARCAHDPLIDFFFGCYDIIDDVINITDEEAFNCYIARFIHLL